MVSLDAYGETVAGELCRSRKAAERSAFIHVLELYAGCGCIVLV